MALQTATNPDTGERVALVGGEWLPISQSATNEQGQKAYLVNNQWMTEPVKPIDNSSDLVRGFKSYLPQTQETFGGVQTLLGMGAKKALGEGDISSYLMEHGKQNIAAANIAQEKLGKPTDSLSEAWNQGIGSVVTDWLPYQMGSGAANILETGATALGGAALGSVIPGIGTAAGAVEGVVGKALVKQGVKEAAAKILEAEGKDAAEAYIAKQAAKQLGSYGGTAAQAVFHGAGETTSRAVQEAGGDLSKVDMTKLAPAALVHSLADFAADRIGLGALHGVSKSTQNLLLDVGKAMVVTGAKEVPPELLQTIAERYGANLPLDDKKAIQEYIDTAGAAFGMSVLPGSVGGVRTRMGANAAPVEETPAVAEVPKAPVVEAPAAPKEPTLELGMAAPFVPRALPDGSVANTQEELDAYEKNKFEQQYAPQKTEEERLAIGVSEPFKPVVFPDGSVATTPEEVRQYEKEVFQKKYAPQAIPEEPVPEPYVAKPPLTQTDLAARMEAAPVGGEVAGMLTKQREQQAAKAEVPLANDYAFLQREKQRLMTETQTPEVKTLIKRIEDRSGELLTRDIERLRKDKELAAQSVFSQKELPPAENRDYVMASKALGELQATEEPVVPMDRKEKASLQRFEKLQGTPAPLSIAEQQIAQAEKAATSIKSTNLRAALKGKLDPKEVYDIAPKGFDSLSSGTKRGTFISELIANGSLNDYLPPDMHPGSTRFDAEAASEIIKDKLRQKDTKTFDADFQRRVLENEAAQMSSELQKSKEAELALSEVEPPDFKRTLNNGQGIGVGTTQSVVNSIKSSWANAPETVIAASMNDPVVPQEVRTHNEAQKKKGAKGEPEAFIYKGKVYLIADKLDTPAAAMKAYYHEALGHYGLHGVFGKDIEGVLSQILKNRDVDVRAIAEKYGFDMNKASDRMHAAEEVLTHMAQNKPGLTFVKQAIAAIRNWLRKHGVNIKLSDNDIIQSMIIPAQKFVERGTTAKVKDKTFFSRTNNQAPNWVPEHIWRLHELLKRADEEASGRIDVRENKIGHPPSPASLKRNQTMSFRRLNNAIEKHVGTDWNDVNALMVRMNEESNRRETESENKPQYSLMDSLKRWLGNSKVVNTDGTPKVMYHSTYSDFAKPKVNYGADEYRRFGFHVGPSEAAERRISMKESEDKVNNERSGNAGANVMPVYVSAQHPIRLDENRTGRWGVDDIMRAIMEKADKGEVQGISQEDADDYFNDTFDIQQWLGLSPDIASNEYDPNKEEKFWSDVNSYEAGERSDLLRGFLNQLGYDSIVYANKFEGGGDSYIVLKPTQIKSAIGNKGEYSSTNPDINYSRVSEAAGKVKAAAQKALQNRQPIDTGAMAGVDESYVQALGRVFNPENKTIIDKIDGLRNGFWKKVAQGVADQYRTIKDYSQEAYMLARLSKTVDGALDGLMMHGQVFLDSGALNIKQNSKGLLAALQPVGAETDRYMMWIALNREARLPEEKRSLNLAGLLSRRGELAAGQMNGKSRLEVYEGVQKDMNALNKSVLDIALQQGLIDKKAYDRFSNDLFYIPFYKAMEDGDIQGASSAAGLTGQKFSAELKGQSEKPFGDLMENTLRNWSSILSASMKNQASNKTMEAAMDAGAATPHLKAGLEWRDGKVYSTKSGAMVSNGELRADFTTSTKGAIKTMIDGQPTYFEVHDPMLLDAMTSIGYMGPKSKILDVARDFKNYLQYGVTLSPAFKVRNLFRDSISALAISDLKRNPFANVIDGWIATDKNNPAHISALAGGAIFNFGTTDEGNQAASIKRLLKMGVAENTILDTPEKVKAGLKKAFDVYQDWGNKSEAANRMALYNQMKAKGMSHLEASFAARDMLDFSMQGSWQAFRLVTQVVPFLNARVQGLYKLGRDGVVPTSRVLYNTVTGKPLDQTDVQKAQSFGYTTLAVAAASMTLYLAFKDDDDYKKRDEWDRDNFWWFKVPGIDYAFRVPKPFEIGAIGTIAERVLEQIIDSESEGKQFEDSIKRMFADTFAMNPIPQAVKPLIDLYANKDSFTSAPIESSGMERLSKQERTTDTTSPLAKALGAATSLLGEKGELSPVQVDYAIKAYFGWLGGTVAEVSHYAVMPFKDGEYPDAKMMDRVSMGFVKSLPSDQSRYVTAFYENNKQISEAFADMRHFSENGEMDKVAQILEDKGDKIGLNKLYDQTSKNMANVRKQIHHVTNSEDMSGSDKREEITRLKEILSMYAESAEEVRKSMK